MLLCIIVIVRKGVISVEEINLKDLLSYFLNKFSLMIMITVFVGILGCLYAIFIQTPLYNSYTTLVLARVSDDKNSQNLSNDISINSKLVGNYREIIKSNRIMQNVISDLNLSYTIDELKKIVTVTNVADTELIKISVNTKDPSLSSDIANKIASQFSQEVAEIYEIQNITVIDKATPSLTPYNVNILKQVGLYIAIGLVIAFITVFIMYYFDNTIKSIEEVEEKIGLPILGSVPYRSNNTKKGAGRK